MKAFRNTSGFTLIELVLAISLFTILSAGVAVPIIGSHLSDYQTQRATEAGFVLTESWEAVRSIRARDWNEMTNQVHGLIHSNGAWEFFGRNDQENGFTRTVTVKEARRDDAGVLVVEGGSLDSDSKLVKIQISWQPTPYEVRTLEEESLLTHYTEPGVWPPL